MHMRTSQSGVPAAVFTVWKQQIFCSAIAPCGVDAVMWRVCGKSLIYLAPRDRKDLADN